MKVERKMIFTGNDIKEIQSALTKAKKFVMKKPEKKYWRYIYVSIDDADGVNHYVSDGSYDIKNFEKLFIKADKMISKITFVDRYYISVSVQDK